MKTLHIVEARSTTQSLTDDQAVALQHLGRVLASERQWWGSARSEGGHGSVFRLTRLYSGQWHIDVGNVVGVIGLPELTLIIEPKIGLSHFEHLLARSNGLTRVAPAPSTLGTAQDLQRLVIEWFAAELDALFRRGLVKDYVQSRERLPYVRGHAAVASTSRQWLQGRVVADCEFDDFTEDTPVNGYLAAAVLEAMRSPWATDRVRARLAYAARELPAPAVAPSHEIAALDLPAQYAHYTRPLKYASDILRSVGRSLESGSQLAGTFVFNSAAVVEEGIRAVLAAGLDPMRVVKTGGRKLLPALVSVNPDLEIGPPPFTGDVKYKIGDRSWDRQDLAQAVLFAAAYKSPHAIIADFAQQNLAHTALNVGDIQVSRLRWIFGAGVDPVDSEREFVQVARDRLSQTMSDLVASGSIAPSG